MKIKLLALAVLAASVTSAPLFGLSTIFSENFNELTQGLTKTTAGQFYTIGGSNVDVIGATNDGYFDAGHQTVSGESGNVIDLGGTGGNPLGELQTKITVTPGQEYGLFFDLAPSERGSYSASTTTQVSVGSSADPTADAQMAPIIQGPYGPAVPESYFFTGAASGTEYITFSLTSSGNDNVGSLLDNVKVETPPYITSTPEPNTLILLGSGFAVLAGLARRKFGVHKA
jgi:hypothetical protein